MWTDSVVAYMKVLRQHLHGGTEENHENLSVLPIWGLKNHAGSANHYTGTFGGGRDFK
jgi:hypothetical protein